MHKRFLCSTFAILSALALVPIAALAAEALAYGPAPAWVFPEHAPVAGSGASGAAIQVVLSDVQANLAPTVSESYFDSVILIQTPQGLTNVGNIGLSWRPDTDIVTVHKLSILRDGKEIDVLASGQSFSILRREDKLEYAVLSGVLTASIQPEGLRVGDRVELAYTLRRTDPLLGGVPEQSIFIVPGAAIARAHLLARWPADYKMTWRASTFLEGMKEKRTGDVIEISTTRDNDEPLNQPAGAPARFANLRLLQITGHKSWAEVSGLLSPLFDRASKLSKSSVIQAEVARIRAEAPDQKSRTEAALRLVQDQIRNVYLGMNDARIVPADIDATWSRRFGDCKAKTALLLALVREMEVEAEPVAVSTQAGDALPDRLPMIGMFDHVLVRATIAGKAYWLDGTRSGDRLLDGLSVPNYRWGLPLTARGAELLKIEPTAPSVALSETDITVDASAGSKALATFRAETILRADSATATQQVLANLTEKQRDTALRTYWTRQPYWSNNWDEVTLQAVTANFDDARGLLRLSVEGQGMMNWDGNKHLIGSVSIGDTVNLKRDSGPNSDAPFLTAFPSYTKVSEHIRLPRDGKGYALEGANVDRVIAGINYQRSAQIKNGDLTADARVRSVATEFPASEAFVAQKALRGLWDDPLYVRVTGTGSPDSPATAATLPSPLGGTVDTCTETIEDVNQKSSDSEATPVKTKLELLAIVPPAGTNVTRETVLIADLHFMVRDFKASQFSVVAQFDTDIQNMTTDGTFKNYPVLNTASGKLRFCFPLTHIWDDPHVTRPLSVHFYLTKVRDGGGSEVIAQTEPQAYPTDDLHSAQPSSPRALDSGR